MADVRNDVRNIVPFMAGAGLIALAISEYRKSVSTPPADPQPSIKVLLDPGHEGHGAGLDPGAMVSVDLGGSGSSGGSKSTVIAEADANLAIAFAAREKLLVGGYAVAITRDRSMKLSVDQRVSIIKRVKPDIFVSIHHNSSTSASAIGTIAAVSAVAASELNALNITLGDAISRNVGAVVRSNRAAYPVNVRKDKELSGFTYGVLRACNEIGCPGVLLETAFLNDKQWQQDYLSGSGYRESVGAAIMAGVRGFTLGG